MVELMTPAEYPPEVAEAIKAMDTIYPGWAEKIDLDEFDISHADYCVAGLLSGEPTSSSERPEWDRIELALQKFNLDPYSFPFNLSNEPYGADLEEDTAQRAWYSEIYRRQQNAGDTE